MAAFDSEAVIARSTIADNSTDIAGGLYFKDSRAFITDSTIAGNVADGLYARAGGVVGDDVTIQNSTVTGNSATNTPVPPEGRAGGISGRVTLLNTIVAGNVAEHGAPDLAGSVLRSNGHNIVGSSVTGAVPGDRQNVAPRAVFATIDPATGGGKLLAKGIVRLNTDPANPALSGADPITAAGFGQDVINVAGIDADTTTAGDQSFRWVGKPSLTGAAQLGYYISGGNTVIRGSVDADARAELSIQLDGKKKLTEADFRL